MHHFFAYLSKIRWIYRWGMKRNAIQENVMEHSFEVAVISHALAVISNLTSDDPVNPNDVAAAALFHDAAEALTGDLPSPIKYHNPKIRDAFKELEHSAEKEMLSTLPEELQPHYRNLILHDNQSEEVKRIVKAADLIASYLKCKAEIQAGNQEFSKAVDDIRERLKNLELDCVDYFLERFVPSYDLTLDELITHSEHLFTDNLKVQKS